MKRYADLHVHTNHSDGIMSPEQVVTKAVEAGLKVLAISDHDTVTGYLEGIEYADRAELTLIPAVELSTAIEGTELHILGYLIDCNEDNFVERIKEFRDDRLLRGEKIIQKLNELGVDLSMETVRRIAGDAVLGRPHFADALVKEEYVRSFDEAFARYLGYHGPAYVPKYHMTPQEGIELIHQASGVAVLAHPGPMGRDAILPDLVEAGLDGIEAIYPMHNYRTTEKYKKLAADFGLIVTGGSDSHGRKNDKAAIGSITVPKECYDGLLRAKMTNMTREPK
jgi:predicted metal-dependent phosphoesterase TrpH